MPENEPLKTEIKTLILANFELDTTDLSDNLGIISNGFIDSIGTLRLVSLLEEEFDIQFARNEITSENLNTVAAICTFITSKKSCG